jgi:hypothetical protein
MSLRGPHSIRLLLHLQRVHMVRVACQWRGVESRAVDCGPIVVTDTQVRTRSTRQICGGARTVVRHSDVGVETL